MPHALLLARLVVGLAFALSAGSKLRDRAGFRAALEDFQLLPPAAVGPVAVAVPAAEALVALALLGPVEVGFAGALLLLAAFSAALATVLRRRLRVTCSCFGSATGAVSPLDLVRNALLAAAAGLGLAAAGAGPVPAADLVLAVPLAAAAVAVLVHLRDVVVTLASPIPVERP